MHTHHALSQEDTDSTSTVTGPHAGHDRAGRLDHHYWRCERCGLETTDATLELGCWRCTDA